MAPEIQAVGRWIGDTADCLTVPREVETPASAELLTLVAPSFEMRPPEVRHRDSIPDGIARAMAVSWDRGNFPQHAVRFSLLEDVYVVAEGLVVDAAGQVLKGSVTQHSPGEIAHAHAAVKAAMRDRSTPWQTGTYVLCTKRGAKNFGHWLIEMLPKAYLAQQHLGSMTPRYIVPAADGGMRQVVGDSLAMLAIDPAAVLPVGPEPIWIERLILVEGLTHHGVYMSPLVMECIDSLVARVEGTGGERLFVTRTGASRRFVNEAEILRYAEVSGFALVEPGRLSLAAQIAAFKNAKEIVGVSGAEMTNIAFAPRGARVMNIAPAGMPDTFFWFIAGLRGHTYAELRCAQTGPCRGVAGWDTDLVLEREDMYDLFRNTA